MEVIDFTSNPGTRFDSGAPCDGDGLIFGNCQDLRYNLNSGNVLSVSALQYSSLSDTTGDKSYVENYSLGGIKGAGVDSAFGFDTSDSVDDYESLVFTFSDKTAILGWTLADISLDLPFEPDQFRLRVDNGAWMDFQIGTRSVQADPLLKGFKFEFQSKNDSFVVQSLVVPEPESVALVLAGLTIVGLMGRQKRNTLTPA